MDPLPSDPQANDDPIPARLEARLKALEIGLRSEREAYQSLTDPDPPAVQTSSDDNQSGVASGESADEASCERTIEQWKDEIRAAASGFSAEITATPLISVITPLFNTKPAWLAEAALSLFGQTLTDWEWCLMADGSRRSAFH